MGSGKYRVSLPPLPPLVEVAGEMVPRKIYLATLEAQWQEQRWDAENAAADRAHAIEIWGVQVKEEAC